MLDTQENSMSDGPVTGKQAVNTVETLLCFFQWKGPINASVFNSHATRPKSVQSAISLSITGVLAPEASPFSTELSTASVEHRFRVFLFGRPLM
jgi:hypothetical protein